MRRGGSLELPNATRRAAIGAAVTFVAGRHAAHAADDAPKREGEPPLTQFIAMAPGDPSDSASSGVGAETGACSSFSPDPGPNGVPL